MVVIRSASAADAAQVAGVQRESWLAAYDGIIAREIGGGRRAQAIAADAPAGTTTAASSTPAAANLVTLTVTQRSEKSYIWKGKAQFVTILKGDAQLKLGNLTVSSDRLAFTAAKGRLSAKSLSFEMSPEETTTNAQVESVSDAAVPAAQANAAGKGSITTSPAGVCSSDSSCTLTAVNGTLFANGVAVPGNVLTIFNASGGVQSVTSVGPGGNTTETQIGGSPPPSAPPSTGSGGGDGDGDGDGDGGGGGDGIDDPGHGDGNIDPDATGAKR